MKNKIIVESAKLAISSLVSLLVVRGISRIEKLKTTMPNQPGLVSGLTATGLFAGSVHFGDKIKDKTVRAGIQAGAGAGAVLEILNIHTVRSKLPESFQNLLHGENHSQGHTVGADELEKILQLEVERKLKRALEDQGFEVEGDPSAPHLIEENREHSLSGEIYSEEEFLGSDEIYSEFLEGEIYSDL